MLAHDRLSGPAAGPQAPPRAAAPAVELRGGLPPRDAGLEAADLADHGRVQHLRGRARVAQPVPEQRHARRQRPLQPLDQPLARLPPEHAHQHQRLHVHLRAAPARRRRLQARATGWRRRGR